MTDKISYPYGSIQIFHFAFEQIYTSRDHTVSSNAKSEIGFRAVTTDTIG